MDKTKDIRLPKARIAHRHGPDRPFRALRHRLARLKPGSSELVATSIAGAILVATGLMLAGFGAANQEGLAARYTTPALADESQEVEQSPTVCHFERSSGEACIDTWKRAMAGATDELWDGEQDWMDARCTYTQICYEKSAELPAESASSNP